VAAAAPAIHQVLGSEGSGRTPSSSTAAFLPFAGVIAAVYLLSYLYRKYRARTEKPEESLLTVLVLLASGLSVMLISLECSAYYEEIQRRLLISMHDGVLSGGSSCLGTRRASCLRDWILSTRRISLSS
jgi:hypothetical protein